MHPDPMAITVLVLFILTMGLWYPARLLRRKKHLPNWLGHFFHNHSQKVGIAMLFVVVVLVALGGLAFFGALSAP